MFCKCFGLSGYRWKIKAPPLSLCCSHCVRVCLCGCINGDLCHVDPCRFSSLQECLQTRTRCVWSSFLSDHSLTGAHWLCRWTAIKHLTSSIAHSWSSKIACLQSSPCFSFLTHQAHASLLTHWYSREVHWFMVQGICCSLLEAEHRERP